MRLRTTLAVGMLLGAACGALAVAGPPACCDGPCHQAPPNPLAPGRPSPPPCCADGICYPNPTTWGHYATRWRRWPLEYVEPAPAGAQPPQSLGPDVPTYVLPTPDEEDRRAPPPSAPPRAEEAGETRPPAAAPEAPAEEAPSTAPATPPSEFGTPSPDLFGEPDEQAPLSTPPPFGEPAEETPSTAPLVPPSGGGTFPSTPGFGQPTGDVDPPPALPFRAPSIGKRPELRSASRPATTPKPARNSEAAPADDPPPALPIALASWTN